MVKFQRAAPHEVNLSLAPAAVVLEAERAIKTIGLEGRVRVVAFQNDDRGVYVSLWATLPVVYESALEAAIAQLRSLNGFQSALGYIGTELVSVGPFTQPENGFAATMT